MHITKIELENIKSHADSTFEFSRGTTAITGENGAGKTTLIEVVAWTLFDLLDYRKDDFVRRGTKRGAARVTFESSLDQRLYTVYRDTMTGYNVYDPALKMRIADKKEEVCRFLWQHLGVDPGTDLDSLFRRAIGVPQGTFTAIFLEPAAERKKAFDKLLKVEEYRRGADELLKTSRYVDGQISGVREKIARAEGELTRIDPIAQEHRTVEAQARVLESKLEKIDTETAEKSEIVKTLDAAEARLNSAKAELDKCTAEKSKADLTFAQRQIELDQSRAAAEKIASVRADSAKHSSATARLKELERERGEREKLRDNLAKVETALAAVRTDQKHSQTALESALKAHAAIESLKLPAERQDRLEREVDKLKNELARVKAIENQIASLDDKLERLRASYKINIAQLNKARDKIENVNGLEKLQQRDADLLKELAALRASLDRDEIFQREIKNGFCPILSQKCLNLKDGETLESFVTSQFSEIKSQISVLETEHGEVTVALRTSREAEKFSVQLVTLQAREIEIKDEGQRLKEERAGLDQEHKILPEIEKNLNNAETELKALDNPKAQIQVLKTEAGREMELRQMISNIESNLERLESDRRILVEQLESYKDLDAQWTEQSTIRDSTAEAHRIFIANETLAGLLDEREKQFDAAKGEIANIEKRLSDAQSAFAEAARNYDRERHLSEKAELIELQKRQAELRATFDATKKRETELGDELNRLEEIRKSLHGEFMERERLEKVGEVTTFIRDTLKEAAPRVARNYVYHVSLEANQTFREITGNAERTLKWVDDYGIVLEESGYDRPFISLSGGEQMAAALSVRLALLKQLTDLRIAFFDEPTSNLDYERRENLAMQISQIKHFDQLFVISHDDTFEGYVDNVVTVRK